MAIRLSKAARLTIQNFIAADLLPDVHCSKYAPYVTQFLLHGVGWPR